MSEKPPNNATNLADSLQQSMEVIGAATRRLHNEHSVLVIAALASGTIATVLAGITAARGAALISSWSVTCWIVSAFSGSASLCTGLIQQMALSKRVAEWESCLGRLKALKVAVSLADRDPKSLFTEYQEIIKEHPGCFESVNV